MRTKNGKFLDVMRKRSWQSMNNILSCDDKPRGKKNFRRRPCSGCISCPIDFNKLTDFQDTWHERYAMASL
jgi:hypothetical protein